MKKMKSYIIYSFFMTIALFSCNVQKDVDKMDDKQSFDSDWLFFKGNPENTQNPDFNDSDWRKVDLPHDWSIEKLADNASDSVIGPFSSNAIGKTGTGFTVGGTAWYRKHFKLDKSAEGKIAYLQFDGIYMNADVWINGKHVGNHPNGYTSFWYDISKFLNSVGESNTIAVQVKNEGFNARWYSGSGIYRHTWLSLVDPVHISPNSVYANASMINKTKAEVRITAVVSNKEKEKKNVTYSVKILGASGEEVGNVSNSVMVEADQSKEIEQLVEITDPTLWSLEQPYLYSAMIDLKINDKKRSTVTQPFGIRTITIDAENGFQLNGKKIKLKGGSIHHDNGLLGAVALDRAEERKIELLKQNGYNAIRLSHNPSSPYLLEVCDRLGMLVIDELFDVWEQEKFMPQGYHQFFKNHWEKDVEEWILMNRNHPSIIMWSVGNEIMEAADGSGLRIAENLIKKVRSLDTSRPITEGMNDMKGIFTGKDAWDDQAAHMELLDVVGYNYKSAKYESDHQKYPNRVMYGSESYPLKAFEYWSKAEEHPYIIGDFVWTAIDYFGEANAGNTKYESINAPREKSFAEMVNEGVPMDVIASFAAAPVKLPTVFVSGSGDLDITGEKKPPMYYRDILWDNSSIEMLVHAPIPGGMVEKTTDWGWPDEWPSWTWKGNEGKKLKVRVFTKGDRVVLQLNGKIIGENKVSKSSEYITSFEVPYEHGELKATAYSGNKEIGNKILKSAGEPFAVRLTPDRNRISLNRNDLSFVKIELIDKNGIIVPSDNIQVTISVDGDGELAASGNANPMDMESVNNQTVKFWKGKAQAIIRPKGKMGIATLKVSSVGLQEGKVQILFVE